MCPTYMKKSYIYEKEIISLSTCVRSQYIYIYPSLQNSCSKTVHLSKVTKVFVGEITAQIGRLLIFSATKYSQPCFSYSRKCTISRLWILSRGILNMALKHSRKHYNAIGITATHCNTHLLRDVCAHNIYAYIYIEHGTTPHCNTLQHTATHCHTLQHTATHCNTLQRTKTHCNTLQHTSLARCVLTIYIHPLTEEIRLKIFGSPYFRSSHAHETLLFEILVTPVKACWKVTGTH